MLITQEEVNVDLFDEVKRLEKEEILNTRFGELLISEILYNIEEQ